LWNFVRTSRHDSLNSESTTLLLVTSTWVDRDAVADWRRRHQTSAESELDDESPLNWEDGSTFQSGAAADPSSKTMSR
jgi:heme-degrading monooxygenase HmoA